MAALVLAVAAVRGVGDFCHSWSTRDGVPCSLSVELSNADSGTG